MAAGPRRPRVLTDQLQLRVSPTQLARWQAVASREPDLHFHEWVRRTLDEAADFALRHTPTSDEGA